MNMRRMFLAFVYGGLLVGSLQASFCTGIANDLEEILFDDNIDDQEYRGLDKYEFIASKLGIIGRDHTLQDVIGRFFKALSYPGMVAAYFSTVIIIKNDWDAEINQQLALGALSAAATYLVLNYLGDWFTDSSAKKKMERFDDFIVGWPSYKTATPEEFHPLFDAFYMLYLNNGNHIDVSEEIVHEVVKKVAAGYVEYLAARQQIA